MLNRAVLSVAAPAAADGGLLDGEESVEEEAEREKLRPEERGVQEPRRRHVAIGADGGRELSAKFKFSRADL